MRVERIRRTTRAATLALALGLAGSGQVARAQDFSVSNLTVSGWQRQGNVVSNLGFAATAEGQATNAAGVSSHAEGTGTAASATNAHAEGCATTASGANSHSEGSNTVAAAVGSHAGGQNVQVLSAHTNAFIHATGINGTKQTAYPYTAHFDRMILFEPANDASNSVLARWENDQRYLRLSGGTLTGTLTIQANANLIYNTDRGYGSDSMLAICGGNNVEIGNGANGCYSGGVAVGYDANGFYAGVGVGGFANGFWLGSSVGNWANGACGAALGYGAYGATFGAAVGFQANGFYFGVAPGYQANGAFYGTAVGCQANGAGTNVAVGFAANAQGGNWRAALGTGVTNATDNSTAVRGALYLDGGSMIYYRPTFGSGSWSNLVSVNLTNALACIPAMGDLSMGSYTNRP